MFSIDDYQYELPAELIAQEPSEKRENSRLLALHRQTGLTESHRFSDIHRFLSNGDVLVVNNTRVIPGRIYGQKETGGKVEALILDYAATSKTDRASGRLVSSCLVNASKPARIGSSISFGKELRGRVLDRKNGRYKIEFSFDGNFDAVLSRIGHVPLPPYIKRGASSPAMDDRTAYQTVYASRNGAVAAPTAGLHFTKPLISELKSNGVTIVEITLHVGYGTFSPVRSADIRDHKIHSEHYEISTAAADAVNRAKASQKKVVAVGTTAVRTLEFATAPSGTVQPGSGTCDLFIYPGYPFKVVDAMITNFHLPRSSLLMLVSAFAGRENILAAYGEAVQKKYRFFSYGDAMCIY